MLSFLSYFKRKRLTAALKKAFPKDCEQDVAEVSSCLPLIKRGENTYFYYCGKGLHMGKTVWTLPSGERIELPYRIFIDEAAEKAKEKLTERQRLIYHAIFSRSYDGYTREKHISALLASEIPAWVMPYIIEVCGEYIKEILDSVYTALNGRDTLPYRSLCALNWEHVKQLHAKMINYWSLFHRHECYRYKDYIGKRLFKECFGYRKTGQKTIERNI